MADFLKPWEDVQPQKTLPTPTAARPGIVNYINELQGELKNISDMFNMDQTPLVLPEGFAQKHPRISNAVDAALVAGSQIQGQPTIGGNVQQVANALLNLPQTTQALKLQRALGPMQQLLPFRQMQMEEQKMAMDQAKMEMDAAQALASMQQAQALARYYPALAGEAEARTRKLGEPDPEQFRGEEVYVDKQGNAYSIQFGERGTNRYTNLSTGETLSGLPSGVVPMSSVGRTGSAGSAFTQQLNNLMSLWDYQNPSATPEQRESYKQRAIKEINVQQAANRAQAIQSLVGGVPGTTRLQYEADIQKLEGELRIALGQLAKLQDPSSFEAMIAGPNLPEVLESKQEEVEMLQQALSSIASQSSQRPSAIPPSPPKPKRTINVGGVEIEY